MTPEIHELVERITSLGALPAKDEIRSMTPEFQVEVLWILCAEVKKNALIIDDAVKILKD